MNKNENRMFHSFSEALPARKGRGKAEKKQPFRNFALHKPHIAKFKRRFFYNGVSMPVKRRCDSCQYPFRLSDLSEMRVQSPKLISVSCRNS